VHHGPALKVQGQLIAGLKKSQGDGLVVAGCQRDLQQPLLDQEATGQGLMLRSQEQGVAFCDPESGTVARRHWS
jgi:hypothetical protein